MFFFFLDLYGLAIIQKAFEMECSRKMIEDGYVDMSVYINGEINKEWMRWKLSENNSKLVVLYDNPFPKVEEAYGKWMELVSDDIVNSEFVLSKIEAEAIVNWIYQVYKTLTS